METKSTSFTTKTLIKVSLLAVISFILFQFQLSIPLFPEFLRLDISEVPALIGSFAIGPLAGVAVVLIKNFIHLLQTQTGGIGELANFLVGGSYVLVAGLIYQTKRSKRGAVIALLAGSVVSIFSACLWNYLILLPFYSRFIPLDQMIALAHTINSAVHSMGTFIFYVIAPFNFIKSLLLLVLTLLLYKRISPLLR